MKTRRKENTGKISKNQKKEDEIEVKMRKGCWSSNLGLGDHPHAFILKKGIFVIH